MHQLHIAVLSEYFHPEDSGGTPTMVSHLVRHLQDHYPDLALDVITSTSLYRTTAATPSREEDWQGVRVTRLGTPRSHDRALPVRFAAGAVFSLAALRELLRRPRYDLVLVVTSPPSLPLAAQAYRRLRGAPYIYLMHDLYPDLAVALGRLSAQHPLTRLCRRVQRDWLHAAARVVAIGRCMQARLQAGYGLGEDRIEVIPNWHAQEEHYTIEQAGAQFYALFREVDPVAEEAWLDAPAEVESVESALREVFADPVPAPLGRAPRWP